MSQLKGIAREHVTEIQDEIRKRFPHLLRKDPEIDLSQLRPETAEAVREVLARIRKASKQDYLRILQCVVAVVPLSADEAPHAAGQWVPDLGKEELGREKGINLPGIVKVREGISDLHMTLAHEFGHACETHEDVEEHPCDHGKWVSEIIPNRYAYQWGFEKELQEFWARIGEVSDHHGVPPGTEFEYLGEKYLVTEDHRIVLK